MKYKIIRNIILLLLIFQNNNALFSQNKNIDSLKIQLNSVAIEDKAALLSEIADTYIHISPEISQKYIIEAINVANNNNNIKLLPEIYRIYGIIKYYSNELDSSLYYYQKSKKIAQQLDDKLAIASANINIGAILFETGEFNKALSHFFIAIKIFKEKKNKENEAIAHNNIGLIYRELHKPDSALIYFNNSLQIKKELNNNLGQAYTLINMAIVEYKYNENYTNALLYFNTAEQILLREKDTYTISLLYNEQGNYYYYKNELHKAKEFYYKSLNLSKNALSYKNQKLSYKMLHKIAIFEKDDKKALVFYKKYIACRDTIENKEIVENLQELKLKYETEKIEQKITFLNNSQKLKNKQINLQQKIIIIFIILIITFLIFLFVVFIQNRKMRLANKNLTIKNLEIIKSEGQLQETKTELETIIENIEAERNEEIKTKYKLNIEDNQEQKLLSKIINAFEKDNVYLDKNLSINELANKLDSNKTYISYIVNNNFEMNFSNFVNQYRVKKARILLSSQKLKNYTIEAIAQKSGFKSVTVFNKAFKKFTGLTPSKFIKNLPKI